MLSKLLLNQVFISLNSLFACRLKSSLLVSVIMILVSSPKVRYHYLYSLLLVGHLCKLKRIEDQESNPGEHYNLISLSVDYTHFEKCFIFSVNV